MHATCEYATYVNLFTFANDDMKLPKRHVTILSLIYLSKFGTEPEQ